MWDAANTGFFTHWPFDAFTSRNELIFWPLVEQISTASQNMRETLACVLYKYDVYMA